MKKWVQLYRNISRYFNDFGETLPVNYFNEVDNAAELFVFTCLKLSMQNAEAIAMLLEKGLYCQAMMIMRSTLEALFKINWVCSGEDVNKRNERAYQLEGKVFSDYEKEIIDQENIPKKNYQFFPEEIVRQNQASIDNIRENYSHLIKKDGKFKKPEKLMKNWDKDLSVAFYHFYRTLCVFCHPNPMIKDFLLSSNRNLEYNIEVFTDGLFWGRGVYLIIMKCSILFFEKYKMDGQKERNEILSKMKEYIDSYTKENKL